MNKFADQADKQSHLVRLLVPAIRIQFHRLDKSAGSVRKAANLTDNLEDWKYDLENPIFKLVHAIRLPENPVKLKDLNWKQAFGPLLDRSGAKDAGIL